MIKIHSKLTQTQIIVFLDILKEFDILGISDADIKEIVGTYQGYSFKPIKSKIPHIRNRGKPVKEIDIANLEIIKDNFKEILILLKKIKGTD